MEALTVGQAAKNHRRNCELTLLEMQELTGVNYKTLSAFENSRSSNVNILVKYLNIGNRVQKSQLLAAIGGLCE